MKTNFMVIGCENRSGKAKATGNPYNFTEIEGIIATVDRNGSPRNRAAKITLDGNVVCAPGPHELLWRLDVGKDNAAVMRPVSLTPVEKGAK